MPEKATQEIPVAIRVWGDYACFTRPEMKVERVSYPVPTPSAARGILEAIYWEPQMYYLIDNIGVVKKGRWVNFRRNEVSAVVDLDRVPNWAKGGEVDYIHAGGGGGDAAQRNMLALADVEYVITAQVRLTSRHNPRTDNLLKYRDQVRERASKGKCFCRPAFGCREFAADFEWVDDIKLLPLANWPEEDLGIMLYDVFDPTLRCEERQIEPKPVFFRAVVVDGKLECHPDRVKIL